MLIDITEDLKYLGGQGQDALDGYDLDSIYGYKILYAPVGDVTYKCETAIGIGDVNINCSDSWQNAVMKVKVSDLLESDKTFDIVADQYYKIGTGRIYLKDGIVKVDYDFYSYYDIRGIDSVKVEIYNKLHSIIKKEKSHCNGNFIEKENVTILDEYAYIRLHFDASIPKYLYNYIEKVEDISTICENVDVEEDKDNNKGYCSDKKEHHNQKRP